MTQRTALPDKRKGMIRKCQVGNFEFYVVVGFYADGRLGEIFVTIAKEGSTVAGLVKCWCIATSVALQCGAEWINLKEKFLGQSFSPSDDASASIIDAIVRAADELSNVKTNTNKTKLR